MQKKTNYLYELAFKMKVKEITNKILNNEALYEEEFEMLYGIIKIFDKGEGEEFKNTTLGKIIKDIFEELKQEKEMKNTDEIILNYIYATTKLSSEDLEKYIEELTI